MSPSSGRAVILYVLLSTPKLNCVVNVCVSCSDTVSRSGMFCAIATTIERCKTEGVVDVFQVVKALRVQKPGAVRTVVSATSYSVQTWVYTS